MFKLITVLKSLVFLIQPHIFFGFLKHPLLFLSNLLSLTKWISQQNRKNTFNDYFTFTRDYDKREKLYSYVMSSFIATDEAVDYLEFGVCGGSSFKWWTDSNIHTDSRFYGFDTFEGLPESWGGLFKKGDMHADVPQMDDLRTSFFKGLFQDTLPGFLKQGSLRSDKRLVVLMDADLFSSTIFTLTSLASHLKPGDIIFFDEFNVPNHEYFAYKIFTESFYFKLELIGAVNNYYQAAFIVK
jgi:hypothetical protein